MGRTRTINNRLQAENRCMPSSCDVMKKDNEESHSARESLAFDLMRRRRRRRKGRNECVAPP
jgi:hypothetical protein